MKKNARIILTCILIFFIILTSSCNRKKDAIPHNVIHVANAVGNYRILNLSDFATEIKYIPLETNNLSLIGVIGQFVYEDKKILIRDNTNSCYLFDNAGKFYQKIGQFGQGPDDYLNISSIWIHDNSIFLQDRSKILIYDFNGYLVENNKFQLDEIPAQYTAHGLLRTILLKKDIYVMNVVSFAGIYPKAILFETFQSGSKLIKEYPGYFILDKISPGFLGTEVGIMYRYKDDVRLWKITNDTVFTIGQDTEMKDAFIFEFGKYRATRSYIERKESELRIAEKNYIIPCNIFESCDHLFIEFNFGNQAPEAIERTNSQGGQYILDYVNGVFDKRTGELTLMYQPIKEKFGFNNDIDGGPVIWPAYISSNDEFVSYIQPEEFLEYYKNIQNPTAELKEIADKLEIYDNPIIIVAKLKK